MLMAMGGQLVADDRVRLWREGDAVLADAPDTLRGRVEARGVGILRADPAGPTRLALVVDLSRVDEQRLPPCRTRELLGVRLPLVLGSDQPHFHAALRQYLIAGRADQDS
jgi:HPr kinase/phosphorylase